MKPVKVLGVLGLLDAGQTDWKVLVIDVRDPLAHKLHDIDDVEKHLPGLLDATRDWFRIYMIPDGYPPNEYAFGGKWKDKKSVPPPLSASRGRMPQIGLTGSQICEADHQRVCRRVEGPGPGKDQARQHFSVCLRPRKCLPNLKVPFANWQAP